MTIFFQIFFDISAQNFQNDPILDLSCSLLEPSIVLEMISVSGQQIKTLAFGPHVQEEKLVGARQVGFDEVMTNGQFNQNLSQIFTAG